VNPRIRRRPIRSPPASLVSKFRKVASGCKIAVVTLAKVSSGLSTRFRACLNRRRRVTGRERAWVKAWSGASKIVKALPNALNKTPRTRKASAKNLNGRNNASNKCLKISSIGDKALAAAFRASKPALRVSRT